MAYRNSLLKLQRVGFEVKAGEKEWLFFPRGGGVAGRMISGNKFIRKRLISEFDELFATYVF